MVTLAKSLGGGLPTGAVGMTAKLAEPVEDGAPAAARHLQRQPAVDGRRGANLHQVLTPAAYSELDRLGDRMVSACESVIQRTAWRPARRPRLEGLRALGSDPQRGSDPGLGELIWIWLMNRGVLTTTGREQEEG